MKILFFKHRSAVFKATERRIVEHFRLRNTTAVTLSVFSGVQNEIIFPRGLYLAVEAVKRTASTP